MGGMSAGRTGELLESLRCEEGFDGPTKRFRRDLQSYP
jgi:hypothetical protein